MLRFSRTQVAFVLILMACSVLMGGCRQQGWKKLSKRQLREVMLDVAFTRALMEERGNLPDSTRQAIYDDLFARHGIKQVDYDSSMAWYARYKIENQVTIVQMVGFVETARKVTFGSRTSQEREAQRPEWIRC